MAAALLIAEFARRHIERGGTWGRIVGLTSGGARGFPEEVSYGAAKAAQDNYTMSASVELADHGVTANMVHPPVTDTGWVTDEVRESVRTSRDHVHIATPDQVAEVIDFLASDAGELVTGNVIVCADERQPRLGRGGDLPFRVVGCAICATSAPAKPVRPVPTQRS